MIHSDRPKLGIEELYTPNGRVPRWMSTDKIPYVNPADGSKSVLVVATDITEKKQILDALKLNEERLNLAVTGSNDALWDWKRHHG